MGLSELAVSCFVPMLTGKIFVAAFKISWLVKRSFKISWRRQLYCSPLLLTITIFQSWAFCIIPTAGTIGCNVTWANVLRQIFKSSTVKKIFIWFSKFFIEAHSPYIYRY